MVSLSPCQPKIDSMFSPRLSVAPRPKTVTAMTQIVLRLTNGAAPIRGMMVPGKGQQFSVYDFMWNTGSFSSKNAITTTFSRMVADSSEHKGEVTSLCCYLKFPGPGQRETPCMSVIGLQRFLCLLGGKIGQQYRDLATTTLTRVAAGDMSLIEEINENAVSEEPVTQLAREALEFSPALPAAAWKELPEPICVKEEELSEAVLGRLAGTDYQSMQQMTQAMSVFVEQRREVIAVLQISNPLVEKDINLGWERLKLEKVRGEQEAEQHRERMQLALEQAKTDADIDRRADETSWRRQEKFLLYKRKREDETSEAIRSFLALPLESQKTQRVVMMSRLEDVMPNKRARMVYLTNLMKVSPPPPPVMSPVPHLPQILSSVSCPPSAPRVPLSIPPTVSSSQMLSSVTSPGVSAESAGNSGVYVLKLSNGRQYVGQSRDISRRIAMHQKGDGSAMAHDPNAERVSCITPRPVPEDLEGWERAETLERMYQYGIEKVRGWVYNTPDLYGPLWSHAYQQICSRKGLCHKCGRSGHFTRACTGQNKIVFGQ